VIAPFPLVADVHALLALAGRGHQRAVCVDARGLLEERRGLSLPDTDADVIDHVHQFFDGLGIEAAAEVACGGGVGNRTRTERVEKRQVVTAQLDVLQHPAPA
jgi:hypothetical protein